MTALNLKMIKHLLTLAAIVAFASTNAHAALGWTLDRDIIKRIDLIADRFSTNIALSGTDILKLLDETILELQSFREQLAYERQSSENGESARTDYAR